MRRSEMLRTIKQELGRLGHENVTDSVVDLILKTAEDNGMQPPPYFITIQQDPPVISERDGFKAVAAVMLTTVIKKEGWESERPYTQIPSR
jgi:nitrogenase molybdenum-iron protein alpha/beta subunit